ncbi:MAG: 3-dehydroquinate synthase [Chloroflexi bacterium]|nr:3-dehydroquinate synthase [Chloroflexota bacterium]|tara:strand:- start:7537 stop:8640 length:1104 start_codon:yes stop_codon:yes gene_type:complete
MTNNKDNLATIVKTSQRDYKVLVGYKCIEDLGKELESLNINGKIFLVCDNSIFPEFIIKIHHILEKSKYNTNIFSLDFNEKTKNYSTLNELYKWYGDQKIERNDTIIAVGGGVTGDIVGFSAATWLRGVNVVHIPTTLAAMVDASIGGKTGINLNIGKNLVGAFHQPILVLSDTESLKSLPKRELASGWAEAIKHSLLFDKKLFNIFINQSSDIKNLKHPISTDVIRKSVKIKSEIVSKDEFEKGDKRIFLNYGHTIGHAIESISEYSEFLHGEAVSIGMCVAAKISQISGFSDINLTKLHQEIIKLYDLPIYIPNIKDEEIISSIKIDKKVKNGKVRWILLKNISKPFINNQIDEEVLKKALKYSR